MKLAGAKAVPADIVITTNGGYPLDQNIYQSVKGMTAAEATCKMVASLLTCRNALMDMVVKIFIIH